jgi:hypothetical protein
MDDGDLEVRLQHARQKIARRKLVMHERATLDEVERFERRYQVALPPGYRRFLLEIANGGEGPSGTLLRLADVAAELDSSAGSVLSRLREPFPLTEPWVWEGDETATHDRIAAMSRGQLPLVNQGCGTFWILIVSGEARNEVWNAADVGVCPCRPRRDFLSWYEYWLDGGHNWWEGGE